MIVVDFDWPDWKFNRSQLRFTRRFSRHAPIIIMPTGLDRFNAAHKLIFKVLHDADRTGYGMKVRFKETEFTVSAFAHLTRTNKTGGGSPSL